MQKIQFYAIPRYLAQKKIPHSCAEPCHECLRADLGVFSRAGSYISPSWADLGVISCAESCHGAFRAGLAPFSCAGGCISTLQADWAPSSRAEPCHGAFRAGLAPFSRAGGYIFSFRAVNDTPFLRRKLPRSIPGWFGGIFLRRRLHFSVPGVLGSHFQRRKLLRSIPGGLGTVFPRGTVPQRHTQRPPHKKTQQGQNPAALKIE